jgi:hypothetical protein
MLRILIERAALSRGNYTQHAGHLVCLQEKHSNSPVSPFSTPVFPSHEQQKNLTLFLTCRGISWRSTILFSLSNLSFSTLALTGPRSSSSTILSSLASSLSGLRCFRLSDCSLFAPVELRLRDWSRGGWRCVPITTAEEGLNNAASSIAISLKMSKGSW